MTQPVPTPAQSEITPQSNRLLGSPPSGVVATSGCALLALEEHGQPSAVLRQAAAVCSALGLDLELLRIVRKRPVDGVLSRLYLGSRLAIVRRSLRARGAARAWCDEVLESSDHIPVHVRIGDFVKEASSFALQRCARLLIIPPREGQVGARVIRLAGASELPVLVLRGGGRFESLVAATDLEDDEYPILRRALHLGQRLRASVVAVHNVKAITAVFPVEAAFATTLLLGAATMNLRRQHLARIGAQLPGAMAAVVCNQCDTVGVILQQAHRQQNTLVVVGTRTKPWLDRLMMKSVAAEVVNRSLASVLVAPVRQHSWCGGVEYRRRSRVPGVPPSGRARSGASSS